jgi:hypothetical protein
MAASAKPVLRPSLEERRGPKAHEWGFDDVEGTATGRTVEP